MAFIRRKKLKILYITPVPLEGAGCRFRIYQYLPYLEKEGIRVKVSPFLFSRFFNVAYKKGMFLRKCFFFLFSCLKRLLDVFNALGSDAIVIYRESFPFGPPVFETLIHFLGKKVIFDFDDAIFLRDASDVNKMLLRLRLGHKPDKIIG